MMRKLLLTVIVIATTAIRKVALHWQRQFSFSDDGSAIGRRCCQSRPIVAVRATIAK
jgi:hypothetical protein